MVCGGYSGSSPPFSTFKYGAIEFQIHTNTLQTLIYNLRYLVNIKTINFTLTLTNDIDNCLTSFHPEIARF